MSHTTASWAVATWNSDTLPGPTDRWSRNIRLLDWRLNAHRALKVMKFSQACADAAFLLYRRVMDLISAAGMKENVLSSGCAYGRVSEERPVPAICKLPMLVWFEDTWKLVVEDARATALIRTLTFSVSRISGPSSIKLCSVTMSKCSPYHSSPEWIRFISSNS